MSDAEDVYKDGLSQNVGCSPLDCYFHWVDAFRLWVQKHCQLPGPARLQLWKQVIKPDLEHLHFSIRCEEFKSKVACIKQRWIACDIPKTTRWVDSEGNTHDILSYLDYKVANTPMIHFRPRTPKRIIRQRCCCPLACPRVCPQVCPPGSPLVCPPVCPPVCPRQSPPPGCPACPG